LSTISSISPRVFIRTPRLIEWRQSRPVNRAASVLPPNLPMEATRMIELPAQVVAPGQGEEGGVGAGRERRLKKSQQGGLPAVRHEAVRRHRGGHHAELTAEPLRRNRPHAGRVQVSVGAAPLVEVGAPLQVLSVPDQRPYPRRQAERHPAMLAGIQVVMALEVVGQGLSRSPVPLPRRNQPRAPGALEHDRRAVALEEPLGRAADLAAPGGQGGKTRRRDEDPHDRGKTAQVGVRQGQRHAAHLGPPGSVLRREKLADLGRSI
jgi:hypothetical protein